MGIPVSGKNMFPSNIAGLPTWYTIRASKRGYVGRKKEVDFLVAMNPETAKEDVMTLDAGAAVVYDEPLKLNALRSDLTFYPVPFDKLVTAVCPDAKLRRLVRNMIYDGVLAKLLGIDMAVMEQALGKQLGKKAKAVTLNQGALKAGWDYAEANFTKQDPFHIERMNETAGKILIEGNAAAAIGCMMAGVTVVAWYPITPSSSLCESLIGYMRKYRIDKETGKATFAIVQAEDEIASLGMVIGAGWAGARAMTATAGPGISLMSEFAGLAYYAETPAVIFDVQRVGPSTGLPTRTAQGDLLSTAFLSHGDTKHILLIPSSVEECYEMAHAGVRPVRAVPDADLRDDGPGPRHEQLDVERLRVSDQADRSRQAADAGDSEEARRVGPLQGRRRRRHRVSHDSRRRHAGVLHARLGSQPEGAVQRASGRLRGQRRPAEPQVRDGAHSSCRRRSSRRTRTRRSASSATARRTGRLPRAAISCAKRRA